MKTHTKKPAPWAAAEAELFLALLLADGPLPLTEIKAKVAAAHMSWNRIRTVKASLGILSRWRDGWVWILPPAPVPAGKRRAESRTLVGVAA